MVPVGSNGLKNYHRSWLVLEKTINQLWWKDLTLLKHHQIRLLMSAQTVVIRHTGQQTAN